MSEITYADKYNAKEGFDHSQQVFNEGDRVGVLGVWKNNGVVALVEATPGGWVYVVRFDLPYRFGSHMASMMGDELRAEQWSR